MANEHVLMTQKTIPVSMTCADGAGIEKGAVLALTDLNTAVAPTAAYQDIAGIAYTEKIANDGNTQIAVLSGPGDELKAVASGAITVGDPLVTWCGNKLVSGKIVGDLIPSTTSGSQVVIGYAKETAGDGETFKYILNITGA